jgi:uncharacterized DUF497 family protein
MRMDIEFDTAKDALNRDKHGVSLAFGVRVFEDPMHLVLGSIRPVDGEDRFKAIGMVEGRLWTAVHVLRGVRVRFISVRKSNDGEQKVYCRP